MMSEKKTTLRQTVALLRRRLADNEDGATAIEYAIVASGVGVKVAATVYNVGSATKAMSQIWPRCSNSAWGRRSLSGRPAPMTAPMTAAGPAPAGICCLSNHPLP